MTLRSALYWGTVTHHRLAPIDHRFSYHVYQTYLDLEELDHVFDGSWSWSTRRPSLSWLRRRDYLGDPRQPLAEAVRELVHREIGRTPGGAIRLLTNLRTLGVGMNPISVFYCFDRNDRLDTVVAEVHNTPWGERHCYVLDQPIAINNDGARVFQTPKEFHVSPFMGMEMEYRWVLSTPSERIDLAITNLRQGEAFFTASTHLQRVEITPKALRAALLRAPWITAQVTAKIYWNALLLRSKGVRVVDHPRHRGEVHPRRLHRPDSGSGEDTSAPNPLDDVP